MIDEYWTCGARTIEFIQFLSVFTKKEVLIFFFLHDPVAMQRTMNALVSQTKNEQPATFWVTAKNTNGT